MKNRSVTWSAVLLAGAFLFVLAAGPAAQVGTAGRAPVPEPPVTFTATAANLNAVSPRSLAQTVELRVDHWTTDAQRDQLLAALKDKGQDALLKVLQDQPRVGFIRTPDSLGYDLRYARVEPWDDGGYRVVLGTDRPISFWEAANRPRTIDYPFTLIELHIKNNGEGEGKMSVATKITEEGNTLVLENYQAVPVQLESVKMKEGK